MRVLWIVLSMAAATTLAAQNPGDSGMAGESVRMDSLRQKVLARYIARAHEVLKMSPDQEARFDSVQSHAWAERRQLMMERHRINDALQDQMQPGMAANGDSVSKLLDARRQVSEKLFQVDDREDREMAGFLSPVQRARYQEFRQHFRERIAEAARNNRPGMRPGLRQGLRPPMRRGRP